VSVSIAPSLLAADFTRLGDEIARVTAARVEFLHVDVMDGHFVPNITFGPPVVQALKRVTTVPLDVHLMIEEPDKYVPAFINAGASIVTVHAEATPHLHRTIRLIRELGAKAGVAINPATPVQMLDEIIAEVDLVLIMSVNPGFTGQKFLPASVRKIEAARALVASRGGHAVIEVDGGIDASNVASVARAGATVIVAGASVFHMPDPAAAVEGLRQAAGAA
jgi:ribulose-phosphate 3-epimerase